MKTLKIALAITALVSVTLTSCRKGEDDPFFSFRSRDARITGEFEVDQTIKVIKNVSDDAVSGSVTAETAFNNSSFSSNFVMDDAQAEISEAVLLNAGMLMNAEAEPAPGAQIDIEYNGGSSASLTIDKDGTYSFEYSFTMTSATIDDETQEIDPAYKVSGTETGRWNWDNSKKNKSGITFVSDIESAYLNGTFHISQLKEKEVVMVKRFKTQNTQGQGDESYSSSTEAITSITLTKKD